MTPDQANGARINIGATTVRRQVQDELRRLIVDGYFEPGQHLSDRALQDTFNVSRTVVREAVRQLEAEGLIETFPHRGSFVRVVTVEEARQIYDVRCVLEAFAASGFARNATDAQIDALESVLNEFRTAIEAGEDDARLIKLKQKFYAILMQGCGNAHVEQMLGHLLNRNTQLRRMSMSAPNRLQYTVTELESLINAIRKRDEQAAWAATVLHVRNAARVALDILLRSQASAGQGRTPPGLSDGPATCPE